MRHMLTSSRAAFLAITFALSLGAATPPGTPTGQEKVIDNISVEGIRLGMSEKEVLDKFPSAGFTPSGGLRRGSFIATITEKSGLLPPGTDTALVDLTTAAGRVVSIQVRFYPSSFTSSEQNLEEVLGAAEKDEKQTMTRKGKQVQTFEEREETWLGGSSYINYVRFRRSDTNLSWLIISSYPKQFNRDHYGPLKANTPKGADFYIAQNGRFVKSEHIGGALVFHLKNAPFEIGSDADLVQVALAQHEMKEIVAELDPTSTFQVSCFRPALCTFGDRDPEKNCELYISDGRMGCEGLTCLDPKHRKLGKPLFGYKNAFQISELFFYAGPGLTLENFKGTLQGFIQVQKTPNASLDLRAVDGFPIEDISPIRLVFE